jgi:hypothetical protein
MLAEALAWLFTPASWHARHSGYLSESIAIVARHRRCRLAWAPHLAASRRALLASAQCCRSRRIALLLGSGPLLDVPLAELSDLFEEVWLVDVVHPWPARRQARRHANVRLIEHDVTEGGLDWSARLAGQNKIDWIASVNLLSQLPPSGPDGRGAMRAHLASLRRLDAHLCVLADQEQVTLDKGGRVVEREDFQSLLRNWTRLGEWRWDVAPPGELGGGLSRYHRIAHLERRQQEDQDDVGQAQAEVDPHDDADSVERGAGRRPVLGRDGLAQPGIGRKEDEGKNGGHQVADAGHDVDVDRHVGHAAHLRDQQQAAAE